MDTSNTSTNDTTKLRKGDACMYCRRRKMKCDGVRPVCGQCLRGDRVEDCEYASSSGFSKTKGLEDAIARMEARIHELESPRPAGPSPNLVLFNPYCAKDAQLPANDDLPNANSTHTTGFPSQAWWTADEPTPAMKDTLLKIFLASANDVGFFLNKARFYQSASKGLPLANTGRPLPALTIMAYLYAIHISKNPAHAAHEEGILNRVLDLLSGALSGNHPKKVMHTIQTEVLLAQYLFSRGRLLEAKYHLSTVVGLGFAARLNKVRSHELLEPSPLPAPSDSVEEGERILACWTVTVMDKCWAVAFDASPNAPCPTDAPGQQCDTPWPLEMDEYERHELPPQFRSSYTIQNFLNNVPDSGTSELAYLSKSAILWEWSNDMVRQLRADISGQDMMLHTNSFTRLDQLIDQLTVAIGKHGHKGMIMPRCIISAAAIRLHSGLTDTSIVSRNKCLAAAEAIVLSLNSIPNLDVAYVNPIIASVWTAAAQVIMKETNTWRAMVNTIGQQEVDRVEGDLKRIYNAGLNVMTVLAEKSQLIRYQEELIQHAHAALSPSNYL
ncbi:hypothetical protein ONZ45_g5118 [Pleurotus djamor]|nr:hypothetical protein ONZ45_g5118 [Pleurotus djamor]